MGKEGVGGGIKTSGEVAEWKKTEPKRYLLEKIALAKKVTNKYKTEYEEVKRRKEAQLKEKEKIKVDILLLQKKQEYVEEISERPLEAARALGWRKV